MVGSTLGKYRIEAQVSAGGMGAIFRAVDVETGQVVALKVLQRPLASDRAFLQRFRREIIALQKVQHPNVVRIYDVGQEGEDHYYAMEYLETSLAEELRSGEIDLARALQVASQVARGLAAVHAAGICHRDVKPSNILFDRGGQAKIADFGIAKLSDVTRVTHTGVIVGTPAYMAPEQVEDTKVDARADIYSLGVVLYEMLVGRPPFGGNTALEILRKHRYTLPESPKAFKPNLPSAVAHLVLGMLAKEPARRPATMTMVADALDHLIQRVASTAEGGNGLAQGLSSTELGLHYERVMARVAFWTKLVAAVGLAALLGYAGYRVAAHLLRGPADFLRAAQAIEATDRPAAIGRYEALIRRFPNAPEAAVAKARAAELREVEHRLAARMALPTPKDQALLRARIAQTHYQRADEEARRGDLEHACQIYRRVQRDFPETRWALLANQRCHELELRLREAPPQKAPPDKAPPKDTSGAPRPKDAPSAPTPQDGSSAPQPKGAPAAPPPQDGSSAPPPPGATTREPPAEK